MMKTNDAPLAAGTGYSTLARARFGPGMLLQHDDLEQLNAYTRDLSRLMFGALFGCGVVCGLVVDARAAHCKVTVTVQGGLALDCHGDPIHVPRAQTLVLDDACIPDGTASIWVALCGTEQCCAPRATTCGDDDDAATVCTRERDGFELRLLASRPDCVCGAPEPAQGAAPGKRDDAGCRCADPEAPAHVDHYEGRCACDGDACIGCECDCVLLARLDRSGEGGNAVWTADHRVRRFVRPVLMRDPQVAREEAARRQRNVVAQAPGTAPAQGTAQGAAQNGAPAGAKRRTRDTADPQG
jgi:hypothetical protein